MPNTQTKEKQSAQSVQKNNEPTLERLMRENLALTKEIIEHTR